MGVGAPLAGLFGLTLLAIAALYVLRVRRPDIVLPSTALWRRAVRDREASVPWQRPRVSWLLLLQLLAAAALTVALVQPFLASAGTGPGSHTVVVLEVGATMQATDVAPSRLDAAKAQVRDLLGHAGPSDRVTLIAMGSRPRVAADASGDTAGVRAALDGLHAENGPADLEGALQLAAGVATPGTRLLLFSDGVTAPLRQPTTLPFAVEYHSVGASGEDLAVSSLTVENGPPSKVAVAHVQNNGREHHHADLEWRVDGTLRDARGLELDAGAGVDVTLPLSDADGVVEARLRAADILALDDSAVAVARAPRTFDVQLVTRQNVFLERALALRGDLRVHVVDPAKYTPDPSADLVVFDGVLPAALPDRPTLVTAPPADARVGTGAYAAAGRPRATAPDDPLVAGIDLSDVTVARTRAMSPPAGFRTLLSGDSGPLVAVRDAAPRMVVAGFDLHESNLPLRTAFPILVDRLDAFLLPAAVPPRAHEPGESIAVGAASAQSRVSVAKPDGTTVTLPAGGGVLSGDDTAETGIYTVTATTGATTERTLVAVDAFDVGRTSPAPRPRPALSGSATAPAAPGGGDGGSPRPLWPALAVAAALVLTLEWWAYHRGW